MTEHTIHTTDRVAEWLTGPDADPGDWVGIFENQELGHPQLGYRVAFLFDEDQWEMAEVGKTQAPDSQVYGLGWRYVLIAKTRDVDEAVRLINHEVQDG